MKPSLPITIVDPDAAGFGDEALWLAPATATGRTTMPTAISDAMSVRGTRIGTPFLSGGPMVEDRVVDHG